MRLRIYIWWFLAALFLCCVRVNGALSGAQVHLAWDPSPLAGCTYTLFAHTNTLTATNLATAVVKQTVGTNVTATVDSPIPARWWFAVTARQNGVDSESSNILLIEVPAPPANLRTVAIQYGGSLTNFYDVGFFRLRLP